ncbi:hypothetical protein JMF89_01280 [Clostridiaceae bacterium UIB06]|uniref:Uncharacterized protein n=1 Tax=Clostridium thailandense TaxID=2794346 RepID=A0A949X5Q9_9CLOT|nr:hypothetical protein [Clostridium thailandense]MBV7276048.1 hypothetical protein [Clostridium thailandense]MCH5135847.1 hypothetical protein [Clostridiaceae bacterium UIB06]
MSNVLKEAVYEKMMDMADDKELVVYENYEISERHGTETYVVIIEISSYRFRIYQGMLHSTGRVSVKYMSVDSDMFKAMRGTLDLKVS